MARLRPDDFEEPIPHPAPYKSIVDTVVSGLLTAGNSMVSLAAGLLAGVLVLYSGYVIYDTFDTQYKAYSSAWDLLKYKPELIDNSEVPMTGSMLESINEDYRAWLTVYDSNIDYPVMQGPNDLYYASHDIYKNSSLTGAIYLAASNTGDLSDSYNLVYGHHMSNKAMFGALDEYRTQAYFDSHRKGIIVGSSGAYDIEFFAVVNTDAYENRIYTVGNRAKEVLDFLRSGGTGGVGLGTSVLFFDEEVAKKADKIVALSTCADANTNGRLVVFGRMIKRERLTIDAEGYYGVYDAQDHTLKLSMSVEEGTRIQYSIDGGDTWTDQIPTIRNVGMVDVLIRAESPTNGTATTLTKLIVVPAPMPLSAEGYEGIADGLPHPVHSLHYVNDGNTVIEYSTDGGKTWSDIVPSLTEPGTLTVIIRASNPNYETTTTTVQIVLLPTVYTLTVRYVTEGEEEIVKQYRYQPNTAYEIITPERHGYTYDLDKVEGVLTEDTEIVVHYKPRTYHLTVRFVDMNGKAIAPSVEGDYKTGAVYSVLVPDIEGYMKDCDVVEGKMGSRDETITVIYVPKDDLPDIVKLIGIGDYETPLGLDHVNMHVGVCFE